MATGTVVEVVMPQMGVSVSEGTVSQWLKRVGDTIERDETILEISTDKVDTEVPSPAEGVVTAIFVEEGDTVDVGVKLAEITVGGEAGGAPAAAPVAPAPAAEPVASAPRVAEPVLPALVVREEAATPTPPVEGALAPGEAALAPVVASVRTPATNGNGTTQAAPAAGTAGRFVSPVVSRIAAEHGIDVNVVPGTGGGGRVTKKDIMSFIEGGGVAAPAAPASYTPTSTSSPVVTPTSVTVPAAMPATPAQPAPTTQPAQAPAPVTARAPSATPAAAPTPAFTGDERVINFTPMRKAIARHMIESVATSAHVTSTMEVDMTRVVNMRNSVKDEIAATWGVKVTFTHFVVRALIDAIAHYPLINAEIRGDSAVIKNYVNLGVAVALDGGAGLIVPVVRNAEEKNLVGIARAINDLATRARTKKLSPDDVSGGTFTLTNPGIYGAIHGTPIINQPQVAIIDTEAIVKRVVVVTDADGGDVTAIRSMMNLCISYDHRLIDGAYAVQFLAHVKRNLQEWDLSRFQG